MSRAAELDGNRLLKTFQDRKSRNENDISNISVNEIRAHDEESMEQPNFYDAVADGSQLFKAYSHSKRRARGEPEPLDLDPVESMRALISQLEAANDPDPTSKAQITAAMQNALEYIESSLIEKAESHKVGTKITFSPTQTPLQPRRSESNRLSILDQTQSDDVLNSTLMQTNHQPSQKSVIKVYMKNELERNESEMEYYENIVNELATRCEDLTAEKSNLEVDLKLYMEEKERLQDDALTLKQHIEALTEEYQRESELSKVAWDTHKQTLLKQIETMTEQLQQTTDANIANEERIRDLTDLIARNDEEAQDSVQRLDRVHEELEESLQKAAELEQEIDEMRERNEELSQQINKFQSKEAETETQLAQQLRDQVESMDAVRATNAGLIDQLKNKRAYIKELSNSLQTIFDVKIPGVDDSELDSEMSPSQTQGALQSIATKVSDLVNQVAQKTGLVATLQSQLENEQVTIGTLQEVNHTLESEIIHLKEEIAKQAQQQQQLVQQEQRGTTVMQQSSDDFSFALSPIKDADGRLTLGMHQSFYGASQQGASKNVLKTYMDNQLELNKAEFEMYETDINKLADQLEATMSERDNLIEKNQSLAQERESLQDTIQALRDTIEHQISENTEELVRASPYSVIRAANPADVDADKTEVYDDTWRVSLENDIALEDTNAEPGDAESSTPDIATLLDKLRELKELTEYYETELNIKNLELEYAEQAMVEIREKVKEQLMDQENRSPGRISSSPDQTDSDAVGAELRRIEAELELKTKELALAEQSIEDITQHWQQTSKSLHEQVEIDVKKLALQSDDHAKVVVALQNDLAIKQQDFDRISNEVARLQQLLEENMRISDQLSNEKLTYEEKIRTLEEHLTEANRQLLEHRSKVQDQDTLITQLQLKQTKLQETVSNFTFNSNDIYIATLQTELESLRDEVETKASELDILRSKELRYGTMESIHQMDIEQLEAKYQSIIDGLQQKLEESKAVYDAVSAAGASTEDNELINQANQELIKKLEESNTAAIQMIEELKSEKSRLIERVEGLLADLEESNELGQQQAIEIDTFKDKLTELSEEYETAQLRFDEERDEFESIKNALQDRLDQASNATSSEVDQLNHRVSSIQNDKDELEKHFHSQQSKIAELEANIMCQARNIQTSGQSMEMVQSALVQYRAYFSLQEEELLKHCNLRYNRFAEKVQHLHNTIQSYASTLQKSNHGLQINLETMQQDLQRTQRDLEISREETQLLNSLKETLYRDLEQQQYEKEALEEAIQDLERDNDQRVFLNQSQEKQAVAEDVATLKLKLEDAENSVLELSQNGANLFAKTTRTITYLESECTRFRSLLDHFKLVNLQLTSDLQQAHEEGMRAQSFENRLKLTLENENKLLGRIQLLESTAAQREKEHAKVLMDQQQETEKRVDEMHSELNVLSEKLQHVQTEYHTNVQALLDEKEARITIEEIFMQEKAQLRNKYSEADAERQLLAHRIEESELSCAALQVLVDEKESMLQEMENKVIQLTKESQHLGVNWDKKYSEYEQENRTFLAKINLIEEQLHVAQQDLHQSELSNLSKDEALAASVTNHLAVMDENRNLHAQLLASTTELDSFRTLSEEQQRRVETLVQELESLKAQYIILRDQTHRDTMNKLTLSEDLIRSLTDESEQLRDEHRKSHQDFAEATEKIADMEKRYLVSQTALATAEGQLQAYQVSIQNLTAEQAQVKTQLESVTVKLTTQAKELSNLRSTISSKDNQIELLNMKVTDLETFLASTKGKVISYEQATYDIASQIQAYSEYLSSGSYLKSTDFDDSSNKDSRSELFESPMPMSSIRSQQVTIKPVKLLLSASSPYTPGVTTSNLIEAPLEGVTQVFSDLKAKLDFLIEQGSKDKEVAKLSRSECEELRKRVDTYEQSLHTLQVEKDKLLSDYEIVETELTSSKNDAFLLEKEKSAVLSNYRQSTKHIREVVALLANSLHQFELKVSGAVPGSITNTSVDMSLPTSDDSSFDTFASRTTQVVETYVASVSKHIDALSAELTQKQQTVDKVDREHVSKERAWVQERGMFIEQINALESAMEEVKRSSILSNSEAHKYQQETDRLNRKIQEYSSNNAALELEYKYSVENVNELRTTLSEAENICMDLRSKLKSSQLEIEKQSEQVKSLFDQVTEVTSLVASKDLLIEKNATLIHRLQAEKEAVDNVRKSVELELTRVHVELSEAKSNRSAIGDDDSRASFEVEKLMAALTNTLDQIQSTATPVRSEEYATSALTSRVDQAVKRLNDFRNWSRDEKRSKRTVEEKNEALQHEVASARKALENSQNQLSRLIKSSSEMDSASKETLNIINELQADLTEKKEEIKVLQTEFSSRKILLEEEKRTSQQLTVESRTKESRITYLHDQLEEHKRGERRLADELSSLRKDLSESRLLIDNQAEQLKLSKLNGDRLSGSVELLERGLEKERSDRIAAEKRLLNATGISDSTLKLRYVELEATVQSLGMQLRAAEERRDQLDLQSMDLSRELNAQRRIVQSYDTRFEQVVAEKTALQRDLATVHVELTKQAAAVEIERMSRLKTEAALMTFSQAHAGPSSTETMFTSLVEEMQGQIVTEEQEKKILLDQIHKLRVALEEKENARNQDGRKIQRLEGELTSLQSKLSKAGKEVTSASARSTALRAEGRQSRSQIQQVVTQISELVDTVKSDCKTLGIEIHSSESSYPMAPKHDKTSSNEGLGLQEALGIPNLIRASNTLQDVMQYIRNIPRDRIQMQSTVMRVEAERSRLQKDLTATDSRYHETVAKLREEISNQKAQLLLLQSSSDSHPSASQSNSKAIALEKALLQERSEKEGTLEQLERSKAEIETLHKHLIAATQQKSTGAKASIQAPVAGPSDDSKKEIESLRHELQAVSHHRNVLRDSIDKLEKQIKSKSDALTDVSAQLDTLMRRQQQTGKAAITEDELEAMRRQCARFRARANAMEELASLYRGGIVAIYSDGASFGAAQYGDFNLRAAGSSGTGWIEREIGHVKKSYEDEIRLLDGEVSELRSKLRQSNSYISEVRKRFEDNLKTLYKPNSGSRNTELDSLHQQLDHLNSSVDRAESQVLALEGELVREKSSSRNRHAALIGDLSKALQSREAISLALRRAETQKQAPNSPGFNGIATGVHPVEKYQQKTISNLVQGLVETDHELYETERRIKKQQLSSQQQPLTQSQYQSPGKTKTAQQLEQQLTAFRNHHGDHSQSSAPSRQDSKIPGTSNADILNTSISPIKHSSPERRRSVMGGGQPSHSVYRLAGENDSVLRVSRASITPASIATRKNNN